MKPATTSENLRQFFTQDEILEMLVDYEAGNRVRWALKIKNKTGLDAVHATQVLQSLAKEFKI